MSGKPPITVFFDGECPVCSREVLLYRRLDRDARIQWRDLSRDPQALCGESFSLEQAMALLHVRDADGVLRIGIDAHLVMWEHLPGFRIPARLIARCAPIRRVAEIAYVFFTRYRPGLRRTQPAPHPGT